MIPRYSRDEMAALWAPETKFQIWFEIEAHACDMAALAAEIGDDITQRHGRFGMLGVAPDADIIDDRRELGLSQVRCPRQQHHAAVDGQVEALEKNIAESVVAGQVIHALLAEH